jgi:hypothetical protein
MTESKDNIKIMSVLGLCVAIFMSISTMMFTTMQENNKDVKRGIDVVYEKVVDVKVDIATLSSELNSLARSNEIKHRQQDAQNEEIRQRVRAIENRQQ